MSESKRISGPYPFLMHIKLNSAFITSTTYIFFFLFSGWFCSVLQYENASPMLCVRAKSLKLCLTLCNPMDYSPPGSSVHGILQASILGGLPFPSPGIFLTQWLNSGLLWFLHCRLFLYCWATQEPHQCYTSAKSLCSVTKVSTSYQVNSSTFRLNSPLQGLLPSSVPTFPTILNFTKILTNV